MDKNEYLKKFKRENPVMDLFSAKSEEVGKQLVRLIKKEGITYDEAYASLQYAYNRLRFESNFVEIR